MTKNLSRFAVGLSRGSAFWRDVSRFISGAVIPRSHFDRDEGSAFLSLFSAPSASQRWLFSRFSPRPLRLSGGFSLAFLRALCVSAVAFLSLFSAPSASQRWLFSRFSPRPLRLSGGFSLAFLRALCVSAVAFLSLFSAPSASQRWNLRGFSVAVLRDLRNVRFALVSDFALVRAFVAAASPFRRAGFPGSKRSAAAFSAASSLPH